MAGAGAAGSADPAGPVPAGRTVLGGAARGAEPPPTGSSPSRWRRAASAWASPAASERRRRRCLPACGLLEPVESTRRRPDDADGERREPPGDDEPARAPVGEAPGPRLRCREPVGHGDPQLGPGLGPARAQLVEHRRHADRILEQRAPVEQRIDDVLVPCLRRRHGPRSLPRACGARGRGASSRPSARSRAPAPRRRRRGRAAGAARRPRARRRSAPRARTRAPASSPRRTAPASRPSPASAMYAPSRRRRRSSDRRWSSVALRAIWQSQVRSLPRRAS